MTPATRTPTMAHSLLMAAEYGGGAKPHDYGTGRVGKCGHRLSRYNPGPNCNACGSAGESESTPSGRKRTEAMETVCVRCGAVFQTRSTKAVYCSNSCRVRAFQDRKKSGSPASAGATGVTNAAPAAHADKEEKVSAKDTQERREAVLGVVADGEWHRAREFCTALDMSYDRVKDVLTALAKAGVIESGGKGGRGYRKPDAARSTSELETDAVFTPDDVLMVFARDPRLKLMTVDVADHYHIALAEARAYLTALVERGDLVKEGNRYRWPTIDDASSEGEKSAIAPETPPGAAPATTERDLEQSADPATPVSGTSQESPAAGVDETQSVLSMFLPRKEGCAPVVRTVEEVAACLSMPVESVASIVHGAVLTGILYYYVNIRVNPPLRGYTRSVELPSGTYRPHAWPRDPDDVTERAPADDSGITVAQCAALTAFDSYGEAIQKLSGFVGQRPFAGVDPGAYKRPAWGPIEAISPDTGYDPETLLITHVVAEMERLPVEAQLRVATYVGARYL